MLEDFLHYIWKFQYFDKQHLQTVEKEDVSIINVGIHNHDAGADFEEAIIKIGNLEWRGSIEIDTYGRNWYEHQHAQNEAYQNVILHVVWREPKEIKTKNEVDVPVLVLDGRIDERLWLRYQEFLQNDHKIACEPYWQQLTALPFQKMLKRTLSERLIRKSQHVLELLQRNDSDWEETTYQLLLEHFGFKKNNDAFLKLAQQLPLKIIYKHADQVRQIEALVFGMAGFLDRDTFIQIEDEESKKYFETLEREFEFLSHKYNLKDKILSKSKWKFLRLRPANFPTVRLAQVIGLVSKQTHFFSTVLHTKELKPIYDFLSASLPSYWQSHYHFDKKSKQKLNGLGKSAQQNLIINVFVPIRVAYSLYRQQKDTLPQKWLEEIKAEQNSIVKLFKNLENYLNIKVKSAKDSQAVLELHNEYCQHKKCLSCEVGNVILKERN